MGEAGKDWSSKAASLAAKSEDPSATKRSTTREAQLRADTSGDKGEPLNFARMPKRKAASPPAMPKIIRPIAMKKAGIA